jgi:hypothetical protein
MKRVLSCTLAALLLLTLLSGCFLNSNRDANDVSPSPSGASETPDATVSESPNGNNSSTDTTPPAQTGIERGKWTGNTYESAFTGITFTMPEGWVAATAEEIAQLIGITADVLSDEQKWMIESAKLTTIYDMFVQNTSTNNNVMVLVENLALSAGGTAVTEEEYLDAVMQQLTAVPNMKYTFEDPTSTSVGSKTYLSVKCFEESNEFSQYYFVRRQDDYMIGIIASIFDESGIDTILAQFK